MTRAISIVASCMSETPMSQASRGSGVHVVRGCQRASETIRQLPVQGLLHRR